MQPTSTNLERIAEERVLESSQCLLVRRPQLIQLIRTIDTVQCKERLLEAQVPKLVDGGRTLRACEVALSVGGAPSCAREILGALTFLQSLDEREHPLRVAE